MTADISAVLRDIAQDIEGEAPHYAELLHLAAERIELLDERARLLLAILRECNPDDAALDRKPSRLFSETVKGRMAVDPEFRSALETAVTDE